MFLKFNASFCPSVSQEASDKLQGESVDTHGGFYWNSKGRP